MDENSYICFLTQFSFFFPWGHSLGRRLPIKNDTILKRDSLGELPTGCWIEAPLLRPCSFEIGRFIYLLPGEDFHVCACLVIILANLCIFFAFLALTFPLIWAKKILRLWIVSTLPFSQLEFWYLENWTSVSSWRSLMGEWELHWSFRRVLYFEGGAEWPFTITFPVLAF